MTLLLPLGLLGLLSLAVLLLIYILRPNYQQKLVSSTFVWKLSLKYRKNRLPISKLRNILILILQILLLVSIAMMMAQPAVPTVSGTTRNEKVAILDASASMMVATRQQTRFARAVSQIQELATSTIAEEDGVFSLIVADADAHFLVTQVTHDNADEATRILSSLTVANTCSYGSADIDGAAELAEDILAINSEAEVLLYTGTNYIGNDTFKVMSVAGEDDWNVAVTDAVPVLEDTNTYHFEAEVGYYGEKIAPRAMNITCMISGVNGTDRNLTFTKPDQFSPNQSKTITFTYEDFAGGEPIYSYKSVMISLAENDTFQNDNTFFVYGGEKPELRIQYSTSGTTNFYNGAIMRVREQYKNIWNIDYNMVAPADAAATGYDLYIFEGTMPEEMPTDGVVLLSNPDNAPYGSEITLGNYQSTDEPMSLAPGQASPLTQYMNATRIEVTRYREVQSTSGFTTLFEYAGVPVMIAKNTPEAKVVVLGIDLNYSNFSLTIDFPIFISNLFSYYFPPTLSSNAFEVGDTITLNARGENLEVSQPDGREPITDFSTLPATLVATAPGTYTVTQTFMGDADTESEMFYVHVPAIESNITRTAEGLPELIAETTVEESNLDLTMWFALAALVFLAAEWLLHSREGL